MADTPAAQLAAALRDDAVAGLDLDAASVERLTGLVVEEKRRRAEALSTAIDDGLGMVPRPLRKIVKKLVGG